MSFDIWQGTIILFMLRGSTLLAESHFLTADLSAALLKKQFSLSF